MRDMVLILNFDDASSRATARALRAEQVYCKIVSRFITEAEVAQQQPLGLILAGGLSGTLPGGMDVRLLSGAWPVLAVGDTAAMLCRMLGGDALETAISGSIEKVQFAPGPLTEGMDDCERVLRNVRRLVLPECAGVLASCQEEPVGLAHTQLPIYGVQFALEQNDTDGVRLLLNFTLGICGCTRWWSTQVYADRAVEEIQRLVGDGRAVCAMTGGLTSGVTAMLAHRALGERLQCIFIDTGLMREKKAEHFLAYYRESLGLSITYVQAQERFLEALQGVGAPQEKRRVIGEMLQRILDETVQQMGDFSAVLRSTTCNDVLQGMDAVLRPGLRIDAPVIEPLRELFKEEVRTAAEYLEMPAEIVNRPSFPGGGLALRILGEVSPERLQTLRAADAIFQQEIDESGLAKRLWHYFCVLSPLLGEDSRSVIALRAVNAGSTVPLAHAARLPYDLLERATERILQERPEVARVVYDLSPSSRASGVEWQ